MGPPESRCTDPTIPFAIPTLPSRTQRHLARSDEGERSAAVALLSRTADDLAALNVDRLSSRRIVAHGYLTDALGLNRRNQYAAWFPVARQGNSKVS